MDSLNHLVRAISQESVLDDFFVLRNPWHTAEPVAPALQGALQFASSCDVLICTVTVRSLKIKTSVSLE